ncbi:30S ribosomal protein S11 [Candidatus Berkelbacteria bacterium]|nr:30S ribosomal protein S11 [Candidatus Berkelbacteria bacterium]
MATTPTSAKKKPARTVSSGRIYVQATFNNTIITVTDTLGNVIAWASAGNQGFKGARKSTPYAAQTAMHAALDTAKLHGFQEAQVYVAGVGSGREQAIRSIAGTGVQITAIKDITPIAHNGVRPKKARRV